MYLPLDGSLNDGGSRHATVKPVGRIAFGPGKKGQAAILAGPGNYLEIDLGSALDTSRGATVELWFKTDGWTHPDKKNSTQALVGFEPFGLEVDSQGALLAYEKCADGSSVGMNSDIRQVKPRQWHHAAFVSDPVTKKTVTLYLDGRRQQENAQIPVAPQGKLTGPMRIGARDENAHPFKGQIDEVRLYDRPKSESEIAEDAR